MDLEQVQRPPEAATPEEQPWTTDQLAAFLAEAKRVYGTKPISLLYLVCHTPIAAGLRRGELLGLRRTDLETVIDADGEPWHQLVITGQYTYYGGKHRKATPKSPSGVRRVPIGPELVDVLKAHMGGLKRR